MEENIVKEIKVRYSESMLKTSAFFEVFIILMTIIRWSEMGPFLLVVALGFAWFIIDRYRNPYYAIIDESGVNLVRKKRKFTWDEIEYLYFEERSHWYSNQKDSYLWCVLRDGEEVKVCINLANYNIKKLYNTVKEDFPEVQCHHD